VNSHPYRHLQLLFLFFVQGTSLLPLLTVYGKYCP
jgi:hypothetical protein